MTSGGTEGLSQDVNPEELDFSDLFLYNPHGEYFPVGCDKDDPGDLLQNDSQPPLPGVDHHISSSNQPACSQIPSTTENLSWVVLDSMGLTTRPGFIPAPSPRIEITPSGDSLSSQTLEWSSRALGAYRECVSPASSNSSTGWTAEFYSPSASPCISPSNEGEELSTLDLCPIFQTASALSSPGTSPCSSIINETYLLPQQQRTTSPLPHQRSRSASPQGKRTHAQVLSCQGGTPVKQRSRSPSPVPLSHERQAPYYLHQYQAQADLQTQAQASTPGLGEIQSGLSFGLPRVMPPTVVQDAHGLTLRLIAEQERMGRVGAEVKSENPYIPPAMWPHHPVHHGAYSHPSVAQLPSFEWPLPSQSGQCELLIHQQPRSHHRAQYETEGSRGAVKTPNGGHPEVQLRGYQGAAPLLLQVFIGTADEKLLKPHPFYQVHRITGKTVSTRSVERTVNGTKVLEFPLEQQTDMRVVIDCVGILKLRNSDIGMRNSEMDLGRKNTRVRLVFRVHVPQPGGQLVSLQVASLPVECSQRSAQELPAVEKQDLDRCSVLGGRQMVLTGQNFTSDSKVMFSEKTQVGQKIWEVQATVNRDATQANMLFVEVPAYRSQTISYPAKVNFCVVNGKKKCSQPQHFIYTPVTAVKAEPLDECQFNSYGRSDIQSLSGMPVNSLYHLELDSGRHALNVSPTLYHRANTDFRAHVLTSDPLDDQPGYFQSRAGPLYDTANQFPSNYATARTPVDKLSEGTQVGESFETCFLRRHQSFVQAALSLGKSPPSRYNRDEPRGRPLTQTGSGRDHNDAQTPEGASVKQENLRFAILEDVTDVIRRDQKNHKSDSGGLQQP